MNESQRQAYMEAMGVDCYIPRLQLPGALPSTLCIMPVVLYAPVIVPIEIEEPANNTQPNNIPTVSVTAAKGGGAAATHALFADDVDNNKNRHAKASDKSVAAATADLVKQTNAEKNAPKFILSIVRGSNVLLIDDGLPGHVNPNEYLKLLHNLLFAVGAGNQQLSIDAFVWPINKNSQFDQSETAAREALQAFLAKQVEQAKIPTVILMGEAAAYYSVEQTLAMGELVQHSDFAARIIRCDSGFPLLTEPLLKKQIWQQLQPLYQVLRTADTANKAH